MTADQQENGVSSSSDELVISDLNCESTDTALPSEQSRKSLPKWLNAERRVEVLSAIVSGVGAVLGSAHVGWYWLLGVCTLLVAISGRLTTAINEKDPTKKYQPLLHAVVLALAMLMSVFAYHSWFDPARNANQSEVYYFVINGTDPAGLLYPSGAPGQMPEFGSNPPLADGMTQPFYCEVTLPDGAQWLRLAFGYPVEWVAASSVHPVEGMRQPKIPACS